MNKVWCAIVLGTLLGCHARLPLSEPASTGAAPITSTACNGGAPLEEAMAQVPGIRASWFPDPAGGTRLYVLEAGRPHPGRPPLLLLHGVGPAGLGDFSGVMAALSQHRHVIGVDLPGFGHSDRNGDDFGPERLVAAVDAVVRACAPGKIDVLGHSSGGALALLFAAQRADVVRRLITVDAAGILRPESLLRGQLHGELKGLRAQAGVAGEAAEAVGGLVISMFGAILQSAESVTDTGLLGDSPSVLAATALLDFNFGPSIAGIRAPTLILWGDKDVVMPARIGHLLNARIAHSELAFVPHAGHLPMDDAPAEFVTLIDQFLVTRHPTHESKPAANRATRDASCSGQTELTLTGDYDQITIDDCQQVRLHALRAKHIVIHDSQVRLDESSVSDGLVAQDSNLTLTGGTLRGAVALDVSGCDVDAAGVEIEASQASVRTRDTSTFVFSVTSIASPQGTRILHEKRSLEDAQQL